MVRIERISKTIPDPDLDPTGKRFELIEVYVQEPTIDTNDDFKVSARPYEFEDDTPSKFATSCPHCGQGIWLEREDIHAAVDKFFISCPSCNVGSTATALPAIDPFINPVTEKIAETVLDPDLSKAQDPIKLDSRTVQKKFSDAGVKADPNDNTFNADYQEALEPDKSEIEQILEELGE